VPTGGIAVALRQAADSYGLDAPAELYNESIRFAADGHLRKARERLQMLLCLSPGDGDAHLMLAKVHVAGQKWQEALSALDQAQTSGTLVPKELRRAVEDHLRAEVMSEEEQRTAIHAREHGEIKALRQEARRLRSENAQYVSRVHSLETETRRWAWATAGVSGLSILFIAINLLFGGGATEAEPVASTVAVDAPLVDAEVPAAPVDGPTVAPPAPIPANPTALVQAAAAALQGSPGLEGTRMQVSVDGTRAILSGTVTTHTQRKIAQSAVEGIRGITEVDLSAILVTARTDGATHVVASGDSLSSIAYRYYGESSRTKVILNSNKSTLKGRPNLQIGMQLRIPPVD
jgi:nucleoid-associated protein YgaU